MFSTFEECLKCYKNELRETLTAHHKRVMRERDKILADRRWGRYSLRCKKAEDFVRRESYALNFGLNADVDFRWHLLAGMRMALGINENEDVRIRGDVMREFEEVISKKTR